MRYKQLWIKLSSYKKIRSEFRAERKETVVHYFERLSEHLKGGMKDEN